MSETRLVIIGAYGQTRTDYLRFTIPLLYRVSYVGVDKLVFCFYLFYQVASQITSYLEAFLMCVAHDV